MSRESYIRASRLCLNCNAEFTPTGQNQKYCCKDCFKIYKHTTIQESIKNHLLRRGVKVGVGKGGNQKTGDKSPHYKHGLGILYTKLRRVIKEDRKFCEQCGKDLTLSSSHSWVIHHIDHNKYNNDPSNWKLLCKKCHQIEHECWKAFEGATTIPKGSTPQESGEAQSIQ